MALTDIQIKAIKPIEKLVKYFDGKGLYLEVTPTGSKRWRFKFRFGGSEKLISLGIYPEVSLKEARQKCDDARKQVANGINPSEQRKAQKAAITSQTVNSFEVVAREWLAKQITVWAESHTRTIILRLEHDVFPYIGKRVVSEITPPELLEVLRRIEAREAFETAHRVKSNCGQIFRYAIATGRATSDPSRDLKGALRPVKAQHLAAVTDPKQVAELLRMMDGHKGSPIVTAALKLAPLVFVRPGELRQAEWKDIDFEAAEWRFIASKTKTQHIVPLANQAITVLKELYPLTGRSKYVFPSARTFDRPMSDNAILAALRSLGISKEEMCGHGFRAIARTILDEILGFRVEFIEHQLAHAVKDTHGRAYNRTKHLPERKEMMQRWADYLDKLKDTK